MNHSTFHSAIQEAKSFLLENKIVCHDFENELFSGGVSYGETRTFNFEIESMKGKRTKKWFHFVVTRLDSGFYEVVNYVL
jgi:hypothetical protein